MITVGRVPSVIAAHRIRMARPVHVDLGVTMTRRTE